MRQAASLVIAAWLEMCKEQQSSGPFAIVSCQNEALGKRKSKSQSQFPHAINKWNEGILKIVKIYEIRQKYIFKLWRSLKDERDTNESVVVHFGLMLLTKIMHPWRRLCCARNIYRKSSVCVVGNLSQHLVLRGLRLLKTIFLVWLALTQYRGSKNRCVKWVLGRPHSKHTEKYFCQWVAACFYAKMLKGRVLKARICLQKNQVEIAFSTWYSIAVGRSFQRGAVLRRVLIRSRRQMLEAFCEWQSAVLAMLAGKKQQRIFHTRRRIVCKRKTHEALHEWRSAIVDCKLKNRCLSKAQFTVQLVRISNFFRQWELVARHNHRTRKLLSIRKSRMTIARKVNLATLLLSSWLSIIIERKNRERKVARKLFWKTNALKRLVWQHLYSFCTGARLIRNKTQSKISSMRHRLVQKSFTVFVRLNKALSRERLVQNKKSIAKNAAAWISHVRRGKWRRQVIISCSERKSHRLLDCCFAKWITSVNAAYRDAEIDALSASQWRMRVLARAFDQWRRSVESNIRWHAYVFSKIIPMNRGWYSRLTELVSCFSILKYWALEGRLARLHGRICGKIRRYREMENYRGSFLRLAAYCKRRHTLRVRLEQACAVRVRGCMRAAISTWSDRWLSSQSRAQVLQVVSFCTRGSRESGIKRTCFLKFSQSLRLHRFTRCRARTWLRSKFRAWDVHVGIKRALSKQSQVLKSAKYCLERERCKNIKRFVIACWFQKAAGSRRLQTSKSKAVSWQQNRGKQETFTAWCEAVRVRNMLTMKRATRRLTPESSTWTSILHKMDARRECKQLQVIISWRQMLKCKQMCVNNLVKHISFIIMMWSATIKRLKWILSQVKHMNVCRRECELSRTFGIWADTNAVRRPKLMALFCKIKRSNQIACLRRMLENLHKYASIKKRNRVQLLRASNSADLHGSVFLDLVLDMSMSDIAGRQDYFKDIVIDDVADSIGGRADLIHCVALEAGSIIVHLRMEEGVCGMNRRAQDVVKEIIAQAAMPHSKLKGGHYTCTAKDVKVVSSSAAVHRYILLRRAKSRVLQLWRSYVDQKSGHREFIGQTTKKCLKNILMDVFAIWCVIQKEGRIRQLSLQLEAKQFLHQQVSNTFNEQATMMYDSMDSLLRTLIQKQDQGLHGTLSLKERCELQHGEITRLRQKISSTESERCAAVAGLEAEKVERQRDRERIESELQTQRIRLLAEFCDEKRRLKERRLEAFEMRKGSERVRCKQELAFSCLSYHARRKSKLLSFEEGRRHRCMAQALCWFAILSKQRRQEEMLEQLDGLLGLIRESVNEASRMGRNLLENRPQDATTPRRKYQEIVPLPPSEGRGLQLSGRRFFVREVEPRKPEEPREYQDIVNSARNLSVMILEVSEQNRARVESRVSQDTAYKVLKQRIIRLVAEVQQRSKGRHRMQQIVAKWHGWASYRHARALGHERMCIRFQQHKTKGQKMRVLDVLSLDSLIRLEQQLGDMKSLFVRVQTGIANLKAQVSRTPAESDGESNPERIRHEHERMNPLCDHAGNWTPETLGSDAEHSLEEVALYLSSLRSMNTSLQDRINQQDFTLIEMHQNAQQCVVKEAKMLQTARAFNEQATMMYDSMDSLLRTLIQKQDQGLHGTLSLKERCELQHGEITRLRQKISSTESERCAAVAGLEAEKVERQRDRERIESELQTQRIRLLAEFCDEKRRLKERRLEAFEMRKGSERVRCKQELAFSCLSYHARRKSKLLSFEEGRRHRCMAQALCWFAILSKQRRQEEMLEQLDGLLGLIRESVNEASRMGRNLLENRPQDATTPRRKYQEIVPLPPSEGRGLQLSGRRFFVREVEPRKPEEPREYQDIVNSARNLSVMILEVSEQNRARVESRVSQDTAYKVLKQRIIRLVAEVQQRSKGRHRMQQIVAKWHGWASYRHARALGHERMCIRFQQHKTVARETRAWEAFAKFCLQAKMQKLKNLQGHVTHPEQKLQELEQQVHDLLSAQEKHVVELQARNIQVLTLEDTAVSQAKIIEDMRRQVRDVGTAHDRDVIELQACKENSLRQAQLIADLQQQVKDARGADESEGAHAKDVIELQECKENSIYQAQLIADLQQQIQDARGADESERAEQQNDLDNLKQVSAGQTQMIEDLQRQLQDTEGARNRFERELRDSISETARLRGNEMQLKAENSAIKNECSRLRSYESSIAMIRNRVDELQTREDAAGKEILSLQGKLAASQKVLQQTQQMLQQSEDNVRTIAVKKTELEGVVQTLTASLSAFQTDAFASMEMLRAHNVDLSKKLVETESLARPLSSVLEAVHLDLYDFIACEAAVAQVQISSQIALKQENDDLRSSLEGFNANLEGFKIDQIDQALRCGLERVLSLRGHVMTLEAEKQTLRGECIRLRSAEQSLCTFRARLSEMQSREEDGQQNLLSLQKEKRNVERRLAEANESLRKSDVVIKHLTQDKVDLESELELQRIVNASLRRKPDEKQDYYAPQEQLDHANAPQRPHENVNEDKNVLADDDELTLAEKKARDDKLDILPMPVSLAQTQHTDELFAHGERGGGLLHASQSEIDRGKLLTAVGELQDSLSARARRSRPCTPRLHPPSRDAGLGAEEAHLPRQEDVETEKQRAIQAAIKLRTSRCSK